MTGSAGRTPFVTTLWRPVVRRLLGWFGAPASDVVLDPGARYVCDLRERAASLEVLVYEGLSATPVPGALAVDCVVEGGPLALMRDDRGGEHALRLGDVLWPEADHRHIVRATSALDVPLVPGRRYPAPRWRVGRTLVDRRSVTALGRMLDGR